MKTSQAYKQAVARLEGRINREEFTIRPCVQCKRDFLVPTKRRQGKVRVYCSQRCNNAAWLKRKALKSTEVPHVR